jgi:hypothetical protein
MKKPENSAFYRLLYKTYQKKLNFGGERGIRTPGNLRFNGFQDRRIRPLCHLSGAKIGWQGYLSKLFYALFSEMPETAARPVFEDYFNVVLLKNSRALL